MRYSFFLLLAGTLVGATQASAQRRTIYDLNLVPEAQVELALPGNDYVVAGFNRLVLTKTPGDDTFIGGQLRFGYEHFWSEQWSGGATLRVLVGSNSEGLGDFLGQSGTVLPGVMVRHRSQVGKFTFGQRLGLEYGFTGTSDKGSSADTKDRSLLRLRLDVERLFPLGEKVALRPRISYEPAAYLRLQRAEEETKERVIDFGSLRAEVGLRLSPRLDLTPWVSYQTRYLNTLVLLDPMGNQTGGGRTNLITPQAGLDLRLTLLKVNTERQQLPTQH